MHLHLVSNLLPPIILLLKLDDVWSLFKVSSEDVPSPTNHVTTESADAVFTYTRLDITAVSTLDQQLSLKQSHSLNNSQSQLH